MTTPAATIVITTKNRKDELRSAIRSCLNQTVPLEVLVFDDGSTDGTSELVRSEFPGVRIERVEQSLGIIRARNAAIPLASCDIVFTIDDDCEFVSTRTVEQTLSEFDRDCIAVIAVPCINVKYDTVARPVLPADDEIYVFPMFMGGSNAMRKAVFTQVGGYWSELYRQYEESDLAVRLLNRGYVVRAGRADPLHHYESPRRESRLTDIYNGRNSILFAWHNVPLLLLPVHLAGTTFNNLRYGFRKRRVMRMVWALLLGCGAIVKYWTHRSPVSRSAYFISRRIIKRAPQSLGSIADELPKCGS